ncbi:sedoheptulose-bisphosphatase [Microdochium nivale]|nr:sedoheptulose-bisphosphatase [Microdochium nivale]
MSDANAATPRVFIARHGETEWTISGQCTGNADIPLTRRGEEQVRATAGILVGEGRLIDPARLARVFCSPRQRAVRTLSLLLQSRPSVDHAATATDADSGLLATDNITVTEDIREWDYGAYEGLRPGEIAEQRRAEGKGKWNIWVDGCEGGETPAQVEERLDRLIAEIKTIQAPMIHGGVAPDIMIVAHGHILRAFVKRWLGFPIDFGFTQMMEPGAVGVLSYAHHNIDEPALLVGVGFPNVS